MSIEENLKQMNESLVNLDQSGYYDALKYSYSLLYQTSQLEYFYCHLVKDRDNDHTYYRVWKRPNEHDIAYFNIGRGYPKELMDGHWFYVVKDMRSKMLIIPCTKMKKNINQYEMIIQIKNQDKSLYCLQLGDMKSIDIQRMDLRKPFYKVITPRQEIISFIKENLL
ncbi:MAG: hypothetical protein LUG46_00605 [Erysipelotrichaceae bacterium]|nr:hypothetical protein [Erysipelotrichaceae bacterium]